MNSYEVYYSEIVGWLDCEFLGHHKDQVAVRVTVPGLEWLNFITNRRHIRRACEQSRLGRTR